MIGGRRGDGIVKLSSEISCYVLVVGSGLAGCMAALEASRVCPRVILASAGPILSGSSFFEGTWGLGCIAAESRDDDADLAQTILDVGCGMADGELVDVLVHETRFILHDLITYSQAASHRHFRILQRILHSLQRNPFHCFCQRYQR